MPGPKGLDKQTLFQGAEAPCSLRMPMYNGRGKCLGLKASKTAYFQGAKASCSPEVPMYNGRGKCLGLKASKDSLFSGG